MIGCSLPPHLPHDVIFEVSEGHSGRADVTCRHDASRKWTMTCDDVSSGTGVWDGAIGDCDVDVGEEII